MKQLASKYDKYRIISLFHRSFILKFSKSMHGFYKIELFEKITGPSYYNIYIMCVRVQK